MPVMALVAPGPDVTSTTPGAPRGARVAVGHMCGRLLVPHQDVLDPLLAKDRVIDMQRGATGIAEDVVDTFVLQRADQHISAR